MWRPPNASTAAATAAVLAAGSATSVWTNRPPSSSATALPRALVDVGQHDVGALRRQMAGDALADAVAPAGDECDLAVTSMPWRIVGEGARRQSSERGGEGLAVDDAEVLDRAGHGDVEQAEAPAVVAGDGGGLDHDDGVELQALGRRGGDDGDRAAHGVAFEQTDLGVATCEPASTSGTSPRGRSRPPVRGRPQVRAPRPGRRRAARQGRPVRTAGSVRPPDRRGGLDARGGDGQEPRGEVEDASRCPVTERELGVMRHGRRRAGAPGSRPSPA